MIDTILAEESNGGRSYIRPRYLSFFYPVEPATSYDVIFRKKTERLSSHSFTRAQIEDLSVSDKVSNRLRQQATHCLRQPKKWAGLSLHPPLIMGIVNVTPDSFSDGGDFADHQPAVRHGQQMADQGAAILDIGGESTRPGASTPSTQEEMNRITPVIKALSNSNSLISVDTRRAEVMEAAVTAGASIINDVSALTGDNDSLSFVAARQLPTVLMHMQGTPETMQQNPVYDHVALDIYDFLQKRMEACVDAGLLHSNIAVDPGIGFGKTIAHNLTLINWLSLLQGLGCPIVMGLSRKGFIGKLSQAPNPKDRLPGTLSANLASLSQGAQILRVHDVKEHVQALSLWQALQQNSSDVTTNQ